MSNESAFHQLAADAISAGLVSQREVEIISRPGTRKANYWARHLRDLTNLVNRRKKGKQK